MKHGEIEIEFILILPIDEDTECYIEFELVLSVNKDIVFSKKRQKRRKRD